MNSVNSNNGSGVGLGGITKRVAPAAPQAPASKPSATFSGDALVRSGNATAPAASAAAMSAAAMDRLANAYDPDPAVFAANLAADSLREVVSLVG
ncbi:MAG: hypothetical protein VKN33_05980 [Candidatus Sericytochromatia bacterium]|nr:hypothetical protein [Candidatus Sericytochromatia bacterium]